jgi:DMSO/TMAO reductase YedYZ molybdopterin-dependent catalytic subunit
VSTSTDSEPVFTGYADGRMSGRYTPPVRPVEELLTPFDEWGDVERGNPVPYTLPLEKRLEVGLERETWRLQVVADPETDAVIEQPLDIDFDTLQKIGQTHGARILKGITCNNLGEPLGMGLWEGVPLRVVVWMAKPVRNIRRAFYYGYYQDDPREMFQSSLPIGRVLEEPPGELPILLAYKLNGEFLPGRRGGPVRMLVPEAYGFKSVKWLQKVVLTNKYGANDTYHLGNNDVDSPMKTFARFIDPPSSVAAGSAFELNGIAQVGVSGLSQVQTWVRSKDDSTWSAEDDPYCTTGNWRDAEILGPPDDLEALGLTSKWQREQWPLRYTFVRWRASLDGLPPGDYELRCRSIDLNGIAQPMPRPFPKSGRAEIQRVPLQVL